MNIEGVTNIGSLTPTEKTGKANPKSSPGSVFGEVLQKHINEVDELQKDSDKMSEKLAMGEVDNLHDVVIASEKADLALNLTIQVKNKIVEAYQEMMRMQI